ncbi:unnamed protein product [Adineta ricciae]|uniref:Uncharacterized protein n=1 Tax=Adineta ricciae TaxID=249248 RepID=A0A815WNT4_ADIRI|nr:unnamed protein product [Adineta ricciae]CAF1551544.1 unnamed protein product [Adineta ricciae]
MINYVLKVHRLSDDIDSFGAGRSTDCDFQARLLESQLELLKLNQDRQVRVATAARKIQQHCLRDQGYLGASVCRIRFKRLHTLVLIVRKPHFPKGATQALSADVKKVEFDIANENDKAPAETIQTIELLQIIRSI